MMVIIRIGVLTLPVYAEMRRRGNKKAQILYRGTAPPADNRE